MVSTGTLNRTPVSRACWSSETRRARLSSSTRNAARPRCFLSCCRSCVRGSVLWLPTSSAPKVFMSAAARTLPTPKSRSMSRRVRSGRSSCSSWLMASGMARSHRGFAGTLQVLTASRRTDRLAAACTGSRGRCRPGRRPTVRRAGGRTWPVVRPAQRRGGRRRFRAGWRPEGRGELVEAGRPQGVALQVQSRRSPCTGRFRAGATCSAGGRVNPCGVAHTRRGQWFTRRGQAPGA